MKIPIVRYQDKDLLKGCESEAEKLIRENPFSSKMEYLLNNQGLGKIYRVNRFGKNFASNCLGAVAWITGMLGKKNPKHVYQEDFVALLKGERDALQQVLKDFEDPNNLNSQGRFSPTNNSGLCFPGAIAIREYISIGSEGSDHHLGIYLGKIKDERIMFAQGGVGGDFGIQTSLDPCDYLTPYCLINV